MANPLRYRGYDLESKHLMVGWQITVRKEGAFVINGAVLKDEDTAVMEAQAYVDSLVETAINAPARRAPSLSGR
jgi:hypothetical protein